MYKILTRIATITTAMGFYAAINWMIDYVLYASIIWYLGPISGGCLLAVVMFIVDLLTIRFYDWAKTDWLAIEYAKESLDAGYLARYSSLVRSRYRRLWLALCVVILSIKFNPFIVTIVMRNGTRTYNGLARRDWIIFVTSFIIGQIYWIGVISGGVAVIRSLYGSIF
ncbi:MAG: hypothetical protein ACOYLF_10195 [Blastocatellia bacterium]